MLGFLLGAVVGGSGVAAWLLSTPGTTNSVSQLAANERIQLLQSRFNEAVAEGKKAGTETENRVRHQYEAYRRHPDRPAFS